MKGVRMAGLAVHGWGLGAVEEVAVGLAVKAAIGAVEEVAVGAAVETVTNAVIAVNKA